LQESEFQLGSAKHDHQLDIQPENIGDQ